MDRPLTLESLCRALAMHLAFHDAPKDGPVEPIHAYAEGLSTLFLSFASEGAISHEGPERECGEPDKPVGRGVRLGIHWDRRFYPPVVTNEDHDRPHRISERQWAAFLGLLEVMQSDTCAATRPIDPASWLAGFEAGTTVSRLSAADRPPSEEPPSPAPGTSRPSSPEPELPSGRGKQASEPSEFPIESLNSPMVEQGGRVGNDPAAEAAVTPEMVAAGARALGKALSCFPWANAGYIAKHVITAALRARSAA